MMEIGFTSRGFERIDFEDYNGVKCSLQVSSLATDCAIWLGCNDADPQELIPGEGWKPIPMPDEYNANTRMHLTIAQVKELLPFLRTFVKTGRLTNPPPSQGGEQR
jgi:hypothetical protein